MVAFTSCLTPSFSKHLSLEGHQLSPGNKMSNLRGRSVAQKVGVSSERAGRLARGQQCGMGGRPNERMGGVWEGGSERFRLVAPAWL